ncbi:MAG: hypothetical protein IJF49_06870 [Clostridia bacterium]|nr:hypothetical protein [Clostridia bacterium]
MAISLLHTTASSPHMADKRLIYHLSLDRTMAYICADTPKRQHFLDHLCVPVIDRETIEYRQDILHDFIRYPQLLHDLISLFSRFRDLRTAQKNAGKDDYHLHLTQTASDASAKNILQAQALCLKRALHFVEHFAELLTSRPLRAKGLTDFRDTCQTYCENPAFHALVTACSKYETFSTNGFLDFQFTLDAEGRIAHYALIDHRHIRITDSDLKKKGLPFFKKAEPSHPCTRVYPTQNSFWGDLTITALSDLSKLLATICQEIFAQFSPIDRELEIYETALQYVYALTERNIPFCFPQISTTPAMTVADLYDLHLVMTSPNASHVVPHDLSLSASAAGAVVFGQNGSGKTVFLRAVGTMQLLTQVGLPVPCTQAKLPLYTQIAAQFSEAEKEFCAGNDAGRFEQEVRELARMADTLQAGALVLLNETFQSTAYAEGAQSLFDLLEYFSACRIRWILVSHLRQLEHMLGTNQATILHTTNGYQITQSSPTK